MDKLEYQVQQENDYAVWAEQNPKLAETWKTYIAWQNAGRQVGRGATSMNAKIKVRLGWTYDIDGEQVPRIGYRYARIFRIENTYASTKRYAGKQTSY